MGDTITPMPGTLHSPATSKPTLILSQDRLMYLRLHPLFANVSLEDLDLASDMLR